MRAAVDRAEGVTGTVCEQTCWSQTDPDLKPGSATYYLWGLVKLLNFSEA